MDQKETKTLSTSIKLTLELVPRTCWFSNVRDNVKPAQWNKLKKECFAKANHCCEVCSGKGKLHPVECNEVWEYDDDKKIQKLNGLVALCPDCHQVKHFGFSGLRGLGKQAQQHLEKINQWSETQAKEYISQSFKKWEERNKHQWQLNMSWLKEKGISINETNQLTPQQRNQPKFKKKNLPAAFTYLETEIDPDKIKNYLSTLTSSQIEKTGVTKEHVLLYAVSLKKLELVKLLFEHPNTKHLLNESNRSRITPLLQSINDGSTEIAKYLISQGANPHNHNIHKRNACHFSIIHKNIELVKAIKAKLSDEQFQVLLTQEDNHKRTPLFYVFVNDKEPKGMPLPLSGDFSQKHQMIYDFLSPYVKEKLLCHLDKYGKSVIHFAARFFPIKIFKQLLETGGKGLINQSDNYLITPLHEAAFYGSFDNYHLLLKLGAKDQENHEGKTAAAIMENHESKINFSEVEPDTMEPPLKKSKMEILNSSYFFAQRGKKEENNRSNMMKPLSNKNKITNTSYSLNKSLKKIENKNEGKEIFDFD